MKIKNILTYSISLLLIASCANTDIYRGDVYDPNQVKSAKSIKFGTIVSVSPVKIQAPSKDLGSSSGAVIGGATLSSVGKSDRSNVAVGAVGALVGAIVGSKIEEKVTQVQALELMIDIDGGGRIVVVQKFQPNLTEGTRVKIIGEGSSVNVNPI